jgi:ribosomal protein S18 acetylase RimI-like enzyme
MAVTATRQLSAGELEALAALESRAVSADGGRLKLEWAVLRNRPGHAVRDFLWRENGELLGFLGLYAFGQATVEVAGMVDPAARRRGIATALLEAALPVCREHGGKSVLLVVPGNSEGGKALALSRGARLEHSEHALLLSKAPLVDVDDPRVTLRDAVPGDLDELSALFVDGFGHPLSDAGEIERTERSRTFVVELDGQLVGTVRVSRDADRAGVYGFTIAAQMRGRGIGREVLRRVCAEQFATGASAIGLEVAVENDHALGLYTSLGFERVSTEDYYELEL